MFDFSYMAIVFGSIVILFFVTSAALRSTETISALQAENALLKSKVRQLEKLSRQPYSEGEALAQQREELVPVDGDES